jgi:hypothetical protein
MDPEKPPNPRGGASEFRDLGGQKRIGFLSELWTFLRTNKRWWLLPVMIVILILGLLVFLGGTPLAPFIYTLF